MEADDWTARPRGIAVESNLITEEPFYVPVEDEVDLFLAAYADRSPVLLKGPTGCGKTRFLEHMTYRISQEGLASRGAVPLVTVSCHEDLTSSDLVGRYILEQEETRWLDGPLTRAVRVGAICYMDEVVEARKDTVVVIHSLTDHRRLLPIERLGTVLPAHPDFLLVMSYNPGYQSVLKDLKPSTRQRFVSIRFAYPDEPTEAAIIAHEASVECSLADALAHLGARLRALTDAQSVVEPPSTRVLIYAARMMVRGVEPRKACRSAVTYTLSDDPAVQSAVEEIVRAVFAR